nr:MAG TPA: hypothetical protein [Caudoviricetes sp.]
MSDDSDSLMYSCYSLAYLLREPQLRRIIDCTVILQSVGQ